MVPGWDMGMGMGFEMGIGLEFEASLSVAAISTPATNAPAAYLFGLPPPDTLRVDDLLDFSKQELFPSSLAATAGTHLLHPPPPPPAANSVAAGNWPFASGDIQCSSDHHRTHNNGSFTDDLYVPCEEAAELEWLSKFVEDSFSDVPYPSSAAGHHPAPSADSHLQTDPSSIPGRGARSKRSRAASTTVHHHSHLATTWSSLVPALPSSSPTSTASSSSSSELPSPRPAGSSKASRKKGGGEAEQEAGFRRCTHCLSERTPQWRTGPLGPKTLCNACGVRYKSGRLVPEYRPASSPTFVLTQHSNSHRKVMELRRQKEVVLLRHDHHSAPNAAARADMLFQDYEVC